MPFPRPTRPWLTASLGGLLAVLALGCAGLQGAAWQDDEVVVGLRRTMCMGGCPDYQLVVRGNGEATLVVGAFSEEVFGRRLEQGRHAAVVDLKAWKHVLAKGAELGFDTLQARYDNPMVMDLPAAIVTLEGKEVFNRYGGPNLNELYQLIERQVGATDWTPDPAVAR